MAWLEPITLLDHPCTLRPLSSNDHDGLVESVKDGALWTLWYTLVPTPEQIQAEIHRRLELQNQGHMLPFVIIENDTQKILGMTTYLNIDAEHKRVEIGGTWLRQTAQQTGINTVAKRLLLTHAFETLQCHAVEFRTHFLNQKSRKGIERLGAKLDGILRNHMIMPDQTLRDTCVYSIIASEWPTIKTHLSWLINRKNETH